LSETASLPPTRRREALSEEEFRIVEIIFRGLGYVGALERAPQNDSFTRFIVRGQGADVYGVIVVAGDLYPRRGDVANPNSTIDAPSAAAHEITHFYRWQSGTELSRGPLDEAITSLEAVCRFRRDLNPVQIEALISDALYRLNILSQEMDGEKG
jgi:hypothetical protein